MREWHRARVISLFTVTFSAALAAVTPSAHSRDARATRAVRNRHLAIALLRRRHVVHSIVRKGCCWRVVWGRVFFYEWVKYTHENIHSEILIMHLPIRLERWALAHAQYLTFNAMPLNVHIITVTLNQRWLIFLSKSLSFYCTKAPVRYQQISKKISSAHKKPSHSFIVYLLIYVIEARLDLFWLAPRLGLRLATVTVAGEGINR